MNAKRKPSASSEFKVRRWKKKDIPELVKCHRTCYPDYRSEHLYDERVYKLQLSAFPEGQFLVEHKGKVVGYATSLIVSIDDKAEVFRYDELTGGGTFSTHTPSGDTLYGADIAIHPKYRGQGLAGKLYSRRRRLIRRYNLRRMIAFGRIPDFSKHAGLLGPDEYVEKVKTGELKDSALSAHLKAGYEVKKVLLDYMRDQSSMNYATLLEWQNPKFDSKKRIVSSSGFSRPNRRLRVCTAQYLMRRIDSWEEFERTVEFFADTANVYHCHFLVLPEYFTAQLVYTMEDLGDFNDVIARLVVYHERYLEMLTKFAKEFGLFIVGGSTPVKRGESLYNVAHLFTPSGKVYTQDKLHVTPVERADWNVRPGEALKVFETPFGRIGILVCYDIEFPELTRLLTRAGVEVVFVPFSTDERKAYNRIQFTARARAIENYIYVVTSGNVGNMPTIKNYLINYGQSAVYTPSDFAFPPEATAGIADPNVETVVTAELDLEVLALQRQTGSVRPLFDMRPDLYSLESKVPVEIIRVE